MDLTDLANYFIALLVIMNPLSVLASMIRVTRHQTLAQKKQTAIVATFAVATILLIAVWVGTPLLAILGIRLPAFQVAGSIVLLFIAFSMLYAEESPIKHTTEEQEKPPGGQSGAVVPLAMPMIAGPGAITTIIVNVNLNPGITSQLIISFAALLLTGLMFLILYFSPVLEKMIGQSGINIFNRIGGLILAAIAIQSLATGILQLLPGLGLIEPIS